MTEKSNKSTSSFEDLLPRWKRGEHTEVRSHLGELADDPQHPNHVAAHLLETRLSDLVFYTSQAQGAFDEGKKEEAAEFVDEALEIPEIDVWRDSYEPLQKGLMSDPTIQEYLPTVVEADVLDNEDGFSRPGGSTNADVGEGNAPPDSSGERLQRLQEYLLDSSLQLNEELDYIDQLLAADVQTDLNGLSLDVRRQITQADLDRLLGRAENAFDAYLQARQSLPNDARDLGERVLQGILAVWKEILPKKLKGIRAELQAGQLDKALATCDELGKIRSDEAIHKLRLEIEVEQEKHNNAKVAVDEVGRVLDAGDLSRAEKLLRELPADAGEVAGRVRKARSKVDKLLTQAESLEGDLKFSEAQRVYEQALSLDRDNTNIQNKVYQAKADADRLAEIEYLLKEAEQAIGQRRPRDAKDLLLKIGNLDTLGWRKSELVSLKERQGLLAEDYREFYDTFLTEIKKGRYHWPEQIEEWIEKAYNDPLLSRDQIQQNIEKVLPNYLQQEKDYLTDEMNTILSRGAQEIPATLKKLREIQSHWQPFLDDESRLRKHTGLPVLDEVYASVKLILGYLPVYEQASELLEGIQEVRDNARSALEQGNGHLEVVREVEVCLKAASPEDAPVQGLLKENYAELRDLLDSLQYAYRASSSSHLSDVETSLKIGNYKGAKAKLKALEPVDREDWLDEELQEVWKTLSADTETCLIMEKSFQKAESHWHVGEWPQAQDEYWRASETVNALQSEFWHQNCFAPHRTQGKASQRLDVLKSENEIGSFQALATRLDELKRFSLTEDRRIELDQLYGERLLWETRVGNDHLRKLFQDLDRRRERVLQFLDALKNSQLELADQMLAEMPKRDVDRNYLAQELEIHRKAERDMEAIRERLAQVYKNADLVEILIDLDSQLQTSRDIAKLDIRRGRGQEAQHWANQLGDWQQSLKQAQQEKKAADKARAARNYAEARDLMKAALTNVPERFESLKLAVETELSKLNHLATWEKPYLDAIKRGERSDLGEAQKSLQQAREILKDEKSAELDASVLEEAEGAWLERLEREVEHAWEGTRYGLVDELLDLGEQAESDILDKYRHLMSARAGRVALGEALEQEHLEEAEKVYHRLASDLEAVNEGSESLVWGRRVEVLSLMKRAEGLLRTVRPEPQALEDVLKALEARVDDFWPEEEKHKAQKIVDNLRFYLFGMQARELEERGEFEQAMKNYQQALVLQPSSAAEKQRLERLKKLQELHNRGAQALKSGDVKGAVDAVRECFALGETDVFGQWKRLGVLRKDLLQQLERRAEAAQRRGSYFEALENYQLVKQVNLQDEHYDNLLVDLHEQIIKLRKRYETIASNPVHADPREIEKLLDDMEPVQAKWGLSETEIGWIRSAKTELGKWKEEIEKAERQVGDAKKLLDKAKAGMDEKKFFEAWHEMKLYKEYEERQGIKGVLADAGRWLRAFQEIQNALDEYRNAPDKGALSLRGKLASAIANHDPNAELAITRVAKQELSKNG